MNSLFSHVSAKKVSLLVFKDQDLGVVPQSASWAEMVGRRRSAAELRALWRKAIMEQILLIRMEKENTSLEGMCSLHLLFANENACFMSQMSQ